MMFLSFTRPTTGRGRLSVHNYFFNVNTSLAFAFRNKDRLPHVCTCTIESCQSHKVSGTREAAEGLGSFVKLSSIERINDTISLIHINSREGKCYFFFNFCI